MVARRAPVSADRSAPRLAWCPATSLAGTKRVRVAFLDSALDVYIAISSPVTLLTLRCTQSHWCGSCQRYACAAFSGSGGVGRRAGPQNVDRRVAEPRLRGPIACNRRTRRPGIVPPRRGHRGHVATVGDRRVSLTRGGSSAHCDHVRAGQRQHRVAAWGTIVLAVAVGHRAISSCRPRDMSGRAAAVSTASGLQPS